MKSVTIFKLMLSHSSFPFQFGLIAFLNFMLTFSCASFLKLAYVNHETGTLKLHLCFGFFCTGGHILLAPT